VEVAAPADFRRDTAVQAIGGGRFTAEIKEAWSGPPGPNGGYVAAIILRAIRRSGGSKTKAAEMLGLQPTYLSRLIRVLKVEG